VVNAHERQDELLKEIASRQDDLEDLLAAQDAQVVAIRAERAVLVRHIKGLPNGSSIPQLATQALAVTPEVRFIAMLDGDRIGGFKRPSMTPGK
jgi:hypothetical protein